MQRINNKIRIWVINLERSTERRSFIEKHLGSMGLDFELVKAVDGRNLSKDEIDKYSEKEALNAVGRKLHPNEIGCYLSHYYLWQRMIKENVNEVLILEDDIVINPHLFTLVDEHKNFFPKDWELINFSTDAEKDPIGPTGIRSFDFSAFTYIANRTSCYLINRRGAQKLMSEALPIKMPLDQLTGRVQVTGLKSYGTSPNLAMVSDFNSDIWGNKMNLIFWDYTAFRSYIILKIAYMLKKVSPRLYKRMKARFKNLNKNQA